MLLQIIDDVNNALNAKAYLAALTLVLTIPDICGRAKYGEIGTKKRYIDWYDEYIGAYENGKKATNDNVPSDIKICSDTKKSLDTENNPDDETPYLSGEIVYSLRNSVLHQGTTNFKKNRIKDESNRIDHFIIEVESKKQCNIYCDSPMDINPHYQKTYHMSLRRLCLIITSTENKYYNENKEKFNFFSYNIVDKDIENHLNNSSEFK